MNSRHLSPNTWVVAFTSFSFQFLKSSFLEPKVFKFTTLLLSQRGLRFALEGDEDDELVVAVVRLCTCCTVCPSLWSIWLNCCSCAAVDAASWSSTFATSPNEVAVCRSCCPGSSVPWMLFTAFLNAVTAAIIKFDGIVTGGGIVGLAWFRQPRSGYHAMHCMFTNVLALCQCFPSSRYCNRWFA